MNKVLIVTESKSFAQNVLQNMNNVADCKIVSVINRHEEAVGILKMTEIDSILVKAESKSCQAFDVVAMAKLLAKVPKTYLYLEQYNKEMVSRAKDLGISEVYIGAEEIPTMLTEIKQYKNQTAETAATYDKDDFCRLRTLTARESNVNDRALDEQLSSLFLSSGFPPHIKGYQFLREAVKQAFYYPDIINNITKQLYPRVAEKFETSPSKVERAIRHAIEVAWSRGKIENINSIYGIKVFSKGDKPTNGELIALISDKLLIEHAV